ncbi:unnamed protein product [Musa acuminata subsp. malaccensis]|uniref:(wild Malaysian banana) hypothetical protein n=1 Tax=Musa acuminata subsp. malaccensis TaxID=214687 RepID=A0A804INA0_MUSAM|nr:PREDICTED: abscisic acid receptor PYL12-like [Musa acuminata subsp. malaccensis]CAG1841792.1 unnamed protein product [Musa acuminata subsp. malaccensis]
MSLFTSPVAASPAMHEVMRRYHSRHKAPGQCGSANVQYFAAPLLVVWSLLRRFDRPQDHKRFHKGCRLRAGDGRVGSVREVTLVSGLPAGTSTEWHVISFSVLGGDHRLSNYQSTTSLHEGGEGEGTVVVESYVVDVPPGNTEEDTCVFVDTIIRCNLISLASVAERMAVYELP